MRSRVLHQVRSGNWRLAAAAPLTAAARELGADRDSARTLTARALAHTSGVLLHDHSPAATVPRHRLPLEQDLQHLAEVAARSGGRRPGVGRQS